jgi:hypothetical protein
MPYFMTHGILNGRGPAVAMLGIGVGAIIVFPLLYGFLGFLAGIIGATLFNLVASMVGGIEIELSQGFDPPALANAARPVFQRRSHDTRREEPRIPFLRANTISSGCMSLSFLRASG